MLCFRQRRGTKVGFAPAAGTSIPPSMKTNYLQNKVGHFGVFNGSRFRNEIVPRIREFHAEI
jgi:poly-beta-hydroxyalkanoate depolymerase